jgi:Fe-S cluster biosynthesis and repair protein YggX
MSDTAERIEHFTKMAEADPTNELGHFSLGRALLEAGRPADALASFDRTLGLNANLSKAYQLKAEALLALDKRDEAIAALTEGVKVANARGDLMPRNDMTRQLKELGATIPELGAAKQGQPVGEGQILCRRCGQVKGKLPKPPFSNATGREIFEKICADCWRAWIGMGTKVINELRLPLSDPQAQKVYDQHMTEFLNLKD